MKIILTGGTGFVGSEILRQLLNHSQVTQVTCLLRRPLEVKSSKLKTIILSDFMHYDQALAKELAEHSACIWALGGKASDHSKREEFERVTHGFTLSFARSVAERLQNAFAFCYLSGMGADPSETSTFPWEKTTRHLKGRTERDLEKLSTERSLFKVTSFRPAGILPRDTNVVAEVLLSPLSIRVDTLAEAMIFEAINESPQYRVLSNRAIKLLKS